MGCCFSANNASEKNRNPPKHHHFPEKSPVPESDTADVKENDRTPPPPSLEEETVKEVLSETPTLKPTFRELKEEKKVPVVNEVEDLSEVSEILSLSESFSTSTVTERREDDERSRDDSEVRQRVDRSPAKIRRKRSTSSDFAGKQSLVRRSEPSPRRKNDNVVKSDRGGEVCQTAGRRLSGNNGARRDSGESSVRRSRSPAICNDAGAVRPDLCRSPSSRRLVRSPGKLQAASPENCGGLDGNWPTSESLVSLECFIFL